MVGAGVTGATFYKHLLNVPQWVRGLQQRSMGFTPNTPQISSGVAVRQKTTPLRLSVSKFDSRRTTPPPVEITWFSKFAALQTAALSKSLKCASPYRAKMLGISIPLSSAIISSVSIIGISRRSASLFPTEVLPVPMKPTKTIFLTNFSRPVRVLVYTCCPAIVKQFFARHGKLYRCQLKIDDVAFGMPSFAQITSTERNRLGLCHVSSR